MWGINTENRLRELNHILVCVRATRRKLRYRQGGATYVFPAQELRLEIAERNVEKLIAELEDREVCLVSRKADS